MVDLKKYRYFDIVELETQDRDRRGQETRPGWEMAVGELHEMSSSCVKAFSSYCIGSGEPLKIFQDSDTVRFAYSFFTLHKCVFLQIEDKTFQQQKDYGFLYCDTCIIAGIWNRTPIPARYACLYPNIIPVVGRRASRKGAKLVRDRQESYLVASQ